MKWFVLWLCITGILTTVWIVGFCEGKKCGYCKGFMEGSKQVADEALKHIRGILSDGAILWIGGGTHLLRKGEKLRDYLLEVLK